MELRTEPRFETRSSAVLEVVRDKVYTYDTTITEVSGIGLRIEIAEELTVGETIRLLVNNYHMFAQVRRCVPSGSGFIIGVERIDAWNGPTAGSALIPSKTAITSPGKVLGRPKLNNPLDHLHGAALKALFADPRWRNTKKKYQAVLIAVGCIALAGWAGFGVGVSFRRRPRSATPVAIGAVKQVQGTPKSAADVTVPKAGATVVAPPLQKARAEEPPVQKAEAVASPPLAARPAMVAASKISIKATDVSWVTVCADGARVLDTLLNKGYAGEIPFSHQAAVRFGNAGAIELAIGNQPAVKLGQPGEVKTVKVTPAGFEPITVPSALNCSLH